MEELLIEVAIILIIGLIFSKLVSYLKLPAVTGYIIAGLLLGPFTTKVLHLETLENLKSFSTITLALIAFFIGSEFRISYFKKVGIVPIVIAIFEALTAMALVTGLLLIISSIFHFNFSFEFCLMLGAISSATAPTSTILVIKQYKAKGKTTDTLLSVVAIDDAVALIAFGFALAISNSLKGESSNLVFSMLIPFREIIMSLILGFAIGFIFSKIVAGIKDKGVSVTFSIAMILAIIGLAHFTYASPIMTCMVFGATFCNLANQTSERVTKLIDNFTPPLYIMFFVLAGAALDVSVLPSIGVAGIIYIVGRAIGKISGAYIGARLTHADEEVAKYTGLCLMPQEGVAIGLSLIAQQVVGGSAGSSIKAIILCSSLVFVLVGPTLTKKALQKANNILVD